MMTPQRLHVEPLPEFQEGGDIVHKIDGRIKDILIGLILGDGHLTSFRGQSRSSILAVKGDVKNLSYLQWLYDELSSLCQSGLTAKIKGGYHQYYFYTKSLLMLGTYRDLFYPEGKKVIPGSIKELLVSPLTLAVWYQDDGSLDCRSKYHYNAWLATHCFSFKECLLLAETLDSNFELDVRVIKCTMRGTLRYRLYVTAKSMDHFMELIVPFINPCFAYKIRQFNRGQQLR